MDFWIHHPISLPITMYFWMRLKTCIILLIQIDSNEKITTRQHYCMTLGVLKVINTKHNDNVNTNLGYHLNLCQQFINHYLIPFGCILCFYLNFSACKTSITELSESCEKAINNLQSRFGISSA